MIKEQENYFHKFLIRRTGFEYDLLEKTDFSKSFLYDLLECESKDVSDLHSRFVIEKEQIMSYMEDIAASGKFKEAVMLSNYNFSKQYEKILEKYRNNGKHNYTIRTLMLYLQRFCAKNDMHSFFGPTAHGEIDTRLNENMLFVFKEDLSRQTFFARWAAEALAESYLKYWNTKKQCTVSLRPNVILSKNKIVWLDLSDAKNAAVLEQPLSDDEYGILSELIKGIKIGEVIQSENCRNNLFLMQLEELGVIHMGPRIPVGTYKPLDYIKLWLNGISKGFNRQKEEINYFIANIAHLSDIEDLDKKTAILQIMHDKFELSTSEASSRGQGKFYSDRFITYEDACDIGSEMKLGNPFMNDLDKMDKGIKLWMHFSVHVWERQAELFQKKLFKTGQDEIHLFDYIKLINEDSLFCNEIKEAETLVYEEYYDYYEKLSCKKTSKSATDFLTNYDIPYYTSADIQIAANSVSGINKGDYKIILAECHTNLLFLCTTNMGYWPLSDDFSEEYGEWLSQKKPHDVEFFSLIYKHDNKCLTRGENPTVSVCAYGSAEHGIEIPISELTVKRFGRFYYLYSPGLKKKLISHVSTNTIFDRLFMVPFSLPYCYSSPPWTKDERITHIDRIEEGNVVYLREQWLINSCELAEIIAMKEEFKRFLELNSWRKKKGIPERVFIKLKNEGKPIFLSFNNPVLIDIILRKLKDYKDTFTLSEMLPDSKNLWYGDEKNKYTSEFRLMYFQNMVRTENWPFINL